MSRFKDQHQYGFIILSGILLFIPFLGAVHLFDWDEINFAESAREMIISGNYLDVQVGFNPFWEKPPLFIWMQVLSMKIFGVSEFAARFPNAICGIISLMLIFHVGRKYWNEKFAWLWVMSYAGSILPFFYFKSGIIDPWFNLFIFSSIIYFAIYLEKESGRLFYLCLSSFLLGLAILTKGPVALLIFMLSFLVYLVVRRFRIKTCLRDILIFKIILILTGGFWFLLQILHGNFQVIQDFIRYQIRLFSTKDAGHGGFILYHFIVLLVGVIPASVFALPGFTTRLNDQYRLRVWMLILFLTVLILFTIVKTKIVHYSSLCYFPLTFFAAVFLYKMMYEGQKLNFILRILLISLVSMIGLLAGILPLIDRFKSILLEKGWIRDPFARGNLMAEVNWTGFEPFIGLFFIASVSFFVLKLQKNPRLSLPGIFISTILFVYLSMIIIVPRIESYSQRAAIEFYKSIADEDAYVTTLGFKSYAHLYYAEARPGGNEKSAYTNWLLKGNIDKPVYFVMKINRKERYLKEYPEIEVLYEKNGFVFTKRQNNNLK